MVDPQRGWGLSPKMDTAALLRHAGSARRRLLTRDAAILGTLAAMVGVAVGRLVYQHGTVVVGLAAIILTTALILRRVVRAQHDSLGGPPRGQLRAGPWPHVAFALPTAGLLFLVGDAGLRFGVATAATGLALAWLINLFHWYRSTARVRELWRGDLAPGALAPRLPTSVEERLARLPDMNVVAYSELRAQVPFIGSGSRLRGWIVPIDTRRAAPDGQGGRREAKKVNLGEFYRFLDENWRTERSPELRAQYRVYVDGSRLAPGTALVPDRYGPPVDILDLPCIEEMIEQPVDEDHQRVYYCVESASHDGELVVTSFVHARMRGKVLFVDFTLTALLPPHRTVVGQVRDPAHPVDVAWRVLSAATRHPVSLLLHSPLRLAVRLRSAAAFGRIRLAGKRAVRRGRHIDLGAGTTIREGLATTGVDTLHYNKLRDLDQQAEYLKGRLLWILKRFLDDRDIDTSSFDENSGSVVNHIQTWNIHELKGEVVGLGNANTFAKVVPETPATGNAQKGD